MNLNPSTSLSNEPQPDGPITVNQMNQMMSQILQQFTHQQQETMIQQQENIQQQVHVAVGNAVRQLHQQFSPTNMTSATSAAATASPSPGSIRSHNIPTVLPPKVKISTPSNFTGSRSFNVVSWLFEMNQYLTLCAVTSDVQQIAVASSYLKEVARDWWESRCKQNDPPTQDWRVFADALKQRFQPLAASRTARAQLRHLRQGTMSIAEHSSKFYSVVQLISDMSDADQVELFVYSLRSTISREVDMREPKTLHEAMTIAQKVETLLDTRRTYTNPIHEPRTSSTSTTYTSNPTSSTSSAAPSAMELGNLNIEHTNYEQNTNQDLTVEQDCEYQRYLEDGENYAPNFDIWNEIEQENTHEEKSEQLQAMQQRNGRAPFLPQEEFTRCMKEKLCLRCKKPGHFARQCPLRRHQSQSQPQPKRNFH